VLGQTKAYNMHRKKKEKFRLITNGTDRQPVRQNKQTNFKSLSDIIIKLKTENNAVLETPLAVE
jgi:hypothetical protein